MIFWHEWRSYYKTLFLWACCIIIFDFGMLLLYPQLQSTMDKMATAYQEMGGFATAFGMDELNLGQPIGFYGTYIGAVLSVGGGMFAAIIGTGVLSKEEGGHTAEYLFTLPYSRSNIVLKKVVAVISIILVFDAVNLVFGIVGLEAIDAEYSIKEVSLFHIAQFMMHVEVATICVLISSCTKKVTMGIGLGIALLGYFLDMMSRVLEPLDFCRYITPYYYANAADILTKGTIDTSLLVIGGFVSVVCIGGALGIYNTRDLSS